MEVVVKEREYDYHPGFPAGWSISADSSSKQIQLGAYRCFVKRYEGAAARQFAALNLVTQLKGKFEQNIPRIHDVQEVEEDQPAVYIFYDQIDGDTLDNVAARNVEVNLEKLTDDLFGALHTLQKRGYWFPSLSDRYIIYDKSRNFLLTGIDKCIPVSQIAVLDDRNAYSGMIEDYYRTILKQGSPGELKLNGIACNYLQVIFIVLRLRVFYSNRSYGYNSPDLIRNLPHYLNNISLYFNDIFTRILKHENDDLKSDEIGMIKELIREKIVNTIHVPKLTNAGVDRLTVLDYDTKVNNEYTVQGGKTFRLNWNINAQTRIDLLKNGQLIKSFSADETGATLKENYDGKNRTINYSIRVLNPGGVAEHHVLVTIIAPVNKPANDPTPSFALQVKDVSLKNGVYTVRGNTPFQLSFNLNGFENARLFRNAQFYKELDGTATVVQLKETFDGKEKNVDYALKVSVDGQVHSESVQVQVIAPQQKTSAIESLQIVGQKVNSDNEYIVQDGQPFTLTWVVRDAETLELFRNEQLLKVLSHSVSSIQLTEDALPGKAEYTLQVSNGGEVITRSIVVRVRAATKTPKIEDFAIGNFSKRDGEKYVVDTRNPIILNWTASNVETLKLFRNEAEWKTIPGTATSIEVKDAFDKQETIKYALVASSSSQTVRKELLIVTRTITDRPAIKKNNPLAKWIVAVVLLIAITAAVLFLRQPGRKAAPELRALTQKGLHQSEVVMVSGVGIPANDTSVRILFNSLPGSIVKVTPDSLLVKVPALINGSLVDVYGFIGGNRFELGKSLLFQNTPVSNRVAFYPISRSRVFGGDTLVVYGENFPSGSMSVTFNQVASSIINMGVDSITLVVPALPETTKQVNMIAVVRDSIFRIAESLLYQKPGLDQFAVFPMRISSLTEGSVVTLKGKNLPLGRNVVRVMFNGIKGSILTVTKDRILALVPAMPAGTDKVSVSVTVEGSVFNPIQNAVFLAKTSAVVVAPVSVEPLQLNAVKVGQNLTISGANFPTSGIEVFFNDVNARIVAHTADNLTVQVPALANVNNVKVTVVVNGQSYPAGNMSYSGPAEPRRVVNVREQVSADAQYDVTKVFGGIHGLNVTLTNKSDFNLVEVVVEVQYLRKNGKVLNTEQMVFENVRAGGSQQKDGPKHDKGTKVETRIVSVTTKEFGKQ